MDRRTVSGFVVASIVAVLGSASAAPPAPGLKACPPNKVWSDAQNGCVCAPGWAWNDAMKSCATSCPPGTLPDPAKGGACVADGKACPAGKQWSDPAGACITACPSGKVSDGKGACVAEPKGREPAPRSEPDPKTCPVGRRFSEAHGACAPICGAGKVLDPKGTACIDEAKPCPPGKTPDAKGKTCVARPTEPQQCPEGKEWKDAFDGCVPVCPPNQVLDFMGKACHPIQLERRIR